MIQSEPPDPGSYLAAAICATIRALIVANSYLESEVGELKKEVSHAYVRGRFRAYTG